MHPASVSPRARRVLDRVLADVRAEFEHRLPRMVEATELALTEPLPVGNPALETVRIDSLRNLGSGSPLFIRRFLLHVEESFKSPDSNTTPALTVAADPLPQTLSLVVDDELDNDGTLLDNIASRLSARNSLALQLLGQRFGVLTRAPAYEAETLPLGPNVLCAGLAKASDVLELSRQARLQLFQQFERALVDAYPALLDACNASLARLGILPHLSFVPVRRAPGSYDGDGADAGFDPDSAGTGSPQTPEALASVRIRAAQRAPIDASFATLQSLLQRRRAVLAKLRPAAAGGSGGERAKTPPTLAHDELLEALQRLRANNTRAESVQEYRQILLAQARQQHGHGMALSETDEDSFDLLALFLAQLQRALRRSSPGHSLIDKLFLPMVLSALRDSDFFTRHDHPARELIDAVSLAGARWLGEDDLDPQWLGLLQRAVNSVQRDGNGGPEAFAEANRTLQSGLQTLMRKAEMAERRQVEAARGRERLAIARMRAGEEITRLLDGQTLPQFHDVFVHHVWVDVLSLAYLRSGDDSDAWRQLVETTQHIVAAAPEDVVGALPEASLERIHDALEQVGYHREDAAAIASALNDVRTVPAAERHQLLDKLGARARLGEDALCSGTDPRELQHPDELEAYEQLRNTPVPTWIEFNVDPEHPLRRRLAWKGEASGLALLVNRRGLRAEEETLVGLARKLAAGNAQLLGADATPARSAWEATLDSLMPLASGAGKNDDDGH